LTTRMAIVRRAQPPDGYVGEASFSRVCRAPLDHRLRVVVESADAIQLGKLVLGERERSALDVLAQVRDG
jgi:hypothetical protein